MHASIEQLLALRDGEPVAAAIGEHVTACARCRDALARLEATTRELQHLPDVAPPDLWPAIAGELAPSGAWGWRRAAAGAGLAAAVVLAVALGLRPGSRAPEIEAAAPGVHAAARDAVRLAQLLERSRDLETELRRLKAFDRAVVRVGDEANRMGVEDRLRVLDYGIEQAGAREFDAATRRAYWDERVRLLDSLVQLERSDLMRRDVGSYRVVPATTQN